MINFGDQLDEVYYYREGKQNFYDQLKFEVTSQDTVYQWRRQYVRENKKRRRTYPDSKYGNWWTQRSIDFDRQRWDSQVDTERNL